MDYESYIEGVEETERKDIGGRVEVDTLLRAGEAIHVLLSDRAGGGSSFGSLAGES